MNPDSHPVENTRSYISMELPSVFSKLQHGGEVFGFIEDPDEHLRGPYGGSSCGGYDSSCPLHDSLAHVAVAEPPVVVAPPPMRVVAQPAPVVPEAPAWLCLIWHWNRGLGCVMLRRGEEPWRSRRLGAEGYRFERVALQAPDNFWWRR